jgi:hypothetical protein
MLLNLTNHPSISWPANQKQTALNQYGEIVDLSFPQIDPRLTSDQVERLVEEYIIKIRKIDPSAVHIMGEMTFTFRLVNKLKEIGIPCIASTTERKVTEDDNGNKTSQFKFVQFRSY